MRTYKKQTMDKVTAIANLEKEIITANGNRIMYGINLLPKTDGFGIITYDSEGNQELNWNIDCKVKIS